MLYMLSQCVRSHLTTTHPYSLAELDFLEPMYYLVCSTPGTRNSMGLGCKETNNIKHNNNDTSREASYQDTDGKVNSVKFCIML